jgi:hypothetical protein
MLCDERTFLEGAVDSNANHLQRRLQQQEPGDTIFELGEVKRMAQGLEDILSRHGERTE